MRRVEWLRRQDSNLLQSSENGAVSGDGTTKGTTPVPCPADLNEVVTSWATLPAPLKAAVLAIVRAGGKGAA